jgi:hypothetical protein
MDNGIQAPARFRACLKMWRQASLPAVEGGILPPGKTVHLSKRSHFTMTFPVATQFRRAGSPGSTSAKMADATIFRQALSRNDAVESWERTRPACCRRRRAVGFVRPFATPFGEANGSSKRLRRDAANHTPEACAPIPTASFRLSIGKNKAQINVGDPFFRGVKRRAPQRQEKLDGNRRRE